MNKTYYCAFMDWNYSFSLPMFAWCWRSGSYDEIKKFVERHDYAQAIMFDNYEELKKFILGDVDFDCSDDPEWIHISR